MNGIVKASFLSTVVSLALSGSWAAAQVDGRDSPSEQSQVTSGTDATASAAHLNVEEAFRTALGSIKNHVSLLDSNARFRICRTNAKAWLIRVLPKSDVPAGGLSISVKDDGRVEHGLSQTNLEAAAWLASAKPAASDPSVKLRPESAFRLGIQALAKWHGKSSDSFLTPKGFITLSRTPKGVWFMNVFGYPGSPLGGWWIDIRDDGNVEVGPGL